jgi:KDO2-lipid IV(A) lauroyltransferase
MGDYELARRAFQNQTNSALKLCYIPRINPTNVGRFFVVEGAGRLDAALGQGSGAVLLNPHFGPFLLVMPALGHRGYRLRQVALQGEPPIWKRSWLQQGVYDAKFASVDRRMPVEFINAADSIMAIRKVFSALRENAVVLFASTGRGGRAWHEVDFLGRRATFNITPFRVARKASSPMFAVFVVDEDPCARVIIEGPIGGGAATEEEALEEYAAVLASYVRKYPEHFALFLHDMRANAHWDDHPFFGDYEGLEARRRLMKAAGRV